MVRIIREVEDPFARRLLDPTVAALLIGLVDTFGKVSELEIAGLRILPALSGTAIYLLMAGVLVWRPEGIFGRKP